MLCYASWLSVEIRFLLFFSYFTQINSLVQPLGAISQTSILDDEMNLFSEISSFGPFNFATESCHQTSPSETSESALSCYETPYSQASLFSFNNNTEFKLMKILNLKKIGFIIKLFNECFRHTSCLNPS